MKAMRQLLLMRHAKSSRDDPHLPDHGRPLAPRGRRALVAMRAAIRDHGLSPDIVLVSAATRARQTLEVLEPWDETPLVEVMDALYMANARQMLGVLHGVAETARSVLLIGHNPGLHELSLLLAGAHAMGGAMPEATRLAGGFPTAALAEFSVAGPWWALGDGGTRLVRFLVPDDLPEMAG